MTTVTGGTPDNGGAAAVVSRQVREIHRRRNVNDELFGRPAQ
jgi:hypothetical protein